MNKILFSLALLACCLPLRADEGRWGRHGGGNEDSSSGRQADAPARQDNAPLRQERNSSGSASQGHARQAGPQRHARPGGPQRQANGRSPIYLGHGARRYGTEAQGNAASSARWGNRAQTGNVAHRQAPFAAKDLRNRLRQMGIKRVPAPIQERSRILDADRAHSLISLPHRGPGDAALNAHVVTAAHLKAPVWRKQFASIAVSARLRSFNRINASEVEVGRYYWHRDGGFNYCHYYDPWGYHWYGWYLGDTCFWTRYYADRWWWFDVSFNRWCFYNDGGWWWQDPYHVGDLYVYSGDRYIPAYASGEQVVTEEPINPAITRSPDGSRMVKVMGDSNDAFLYDTSIPPAFNPMYLASKVRSVKFSDPGNGKPMQVLLTLSDGSFDLFDQDGNPAGGSSDRSAAADVGGTFQESPPSGPAPGAGAPTNAPDNSQPPAGSSQWQ